jgi:hypothetical protein
MHMDDEIRTSIMLPRDLLAQVKQLAKRERRSASAQMTVLIERGLQATEDQDQDQGARSR